MLINRCMLIHVWTLTYICYRLEKIPALQGWWFQVRSGAQEFHVNYTATVVHMFLIAFGSSPDLHTGFRMWCCGCAVNVLRAVLSSGVSFLPSVLRQLGMTWTCLRCLWSSVDFWGSFVLQIHGTGQSPHIHVTCKLTWPAIGIVPNKAKVYFVWSTYGTASWNWVPWPGWPDD